MYKKILLLLAVFACSSSFANIPVSAKEIKNGIEYWTVSEMREFLIETESDFSAMCGDDSYCKEDLLYERARTDGKYRALENFMWEKLILSSINPTEEIIKVYYQDEDRMLDYRLGQSEVHSMEDFYMLWVEEWLGNPLRDASWLSYGERYPYFLSDAATVESASHLMIDEDKDRNGAGWFTPNVEREYLVAGSGLGNNTVQMLYYSLLESNGGRTNGVKDYRSCFEGTDYEPGMECRYLFGSDGISRYFPFTPEVSSPDNTTTENASNGSTETSDTDETNSEADSENHAPNSNTSETENNDKKTSNNNQTSASTLSVATKPVIVDTNNAKTSTSQNSTKNIKTSQKNTKTAQNQKVTTSATNSAPSSPIQTTSSTANTTDGSNSSTPSITLPKSGSCEKEVIFPWWFIILVAVCDVVIMWFFWPKKVQKRA
ncbi:hypothetical protein IKE97_02300 [Candidatus Saccharibacteria bacterium]|nr:hypothetical protein [Candidatus Saccharibacteria bacterium]